MGDYPAEQYLDITNVCWKQSSAKFQKPSRCWKFPLLLLAETGTILAIRNQGFESVAQNTNIWLLKTDADLVLEGLITHCWMAEEPTPTRWIGNGT